MTTTSNSTSNRTEPLALAGFVLGIVSLVAWLVPLVGAPVSIVGAVLSGIGRGRARRDGARNGTQATVGLVLSIIGIVLTIASAALGAYLATA